MPLSDTNASGLANSTQQVSENTLTQQQQQMNTIMQQQQQILAKLQAQPQKFYEQNIAIAALTAKVDQLYAEQADKQIKANVVPTKKNKVDNYMNKTVLGQEEWIWFDDLQSNFRARVDTGATTSSLSAMDIVEFERDGRDWVKFNLIHKDGDKKYPIELPVIDKIYVRQTNSIEPVLRYVVKMPVQLGDIKTDTEFTLADRSRMTFPILLGRTFLKDIAVVDVAKEYTQAKFIPDANNNN